MTQTENHRDAWQRPGGESPSNGLATTTRVTESDVARRLFSAFQGTRIVVSAAHPLPGPAGGRQFQVPPTGAAEPNASDIADAIRAGLPVSLDLSSRGLVDLVGPYKVVTVGVRTKCYLVEVADLSVCTFRRSLYPVTLLGPTPGDPGLKYADRRYHCPNCNDVWTGLCKPYVCMNRSGAVQSTHCPRCTGKLTTLRGRA